MLLSFGKALPARLSRRLYVEVFTLEAVARITEKLTINIAQGAAFLLAIPALPGAAGRIPSKASHGINLPVIRSHKVRRRRLTAFDLRNTINK